jgi:hypothetical protein
MLGGPTLRERIWNSPQRSIDWTSVLKRFIFQPKSDTQTEEPEQTNWIFRGEFFPEHGEESLEGFYGSFFTHPEQAGGGTTPPTRAGMYFDFWCQQVMRSRIEPMKKFATTLRAHRELLLNYFRAKKSSPVRSSRASTTRPWSR